jgi:hypothetical protein
MDRKVVTTLRVMPARLLITRSVMTTMLISIRFDMLATI